MDGWMDGWVDGFKLFLPFGIMNYREGEMNFLYSSLFTQRQAGFEYLSH
jgi:hypothetical protein